jgi:hypothetical protein
VVKLIVSTKLTGKPKELLFEQLFRLQDSLSNLGLVAEFGWLQRRSFHKVKVVVARKLTGQRKERLFEIIIGLCGNIVVLKILFPVEGNLFRLHHVD